MKYPFGKRISNENEVTTAGSSAFSFGQGSLTPHGIPLPFRFMFPMGSLHLIPHIPLLLAFLYC